ncbi:hypothetical protein [Xanthomonas cucurbitae]|uniref:Uncharacterized protein n=1 Tax=Xanthomonas cucurbitae TaxID=56453 RepID=A0ABY7YCT0_9XANT|nr:hypothetical protein [Xanthomonas cucurbitae]WDM67814.1 hypothetical protein K6981_00250 [Xanthomonas cucurbitae]WDM71688.1 hypothetical protein K6978_00245 [Xanthomonas cucurbitae]
MEDFDRTLASCISENINNSKFIGRNLISSCYYKVINYKKVVEDPIVSEKWIDFLFKQLGDLSLQGKNMEQAADSIFMRMAKD